jgi:baseplate J-like protein
MSAPPKKPTAPAPTLIREPPPLRSYRPYAIGAGILAVIALLVGILYLPSATATLTVQGTPVKADITLHGAPGVAAGTTDQFPTQAIHGEESQTLPGTATGQKAVAAVAATGSVTFSTTCSGCTDTVRKGQTVETNDGIQFVTQQAVNNITANHPVTVAINAVIAGPSGNVPANAVRNISSYNGTDLLLTPNNGQATAGGADARTATVIQQSDIDNVTTGYLKDATTRVTDSINGKGGGLKLVTVGNGISSTVTTDHKVGDEVNSFSITVKVVGDAVAFDDKAVVALLLGDLHNKIPQGTQLAGTPTRSYDTTGATADGHITANGHVSGFYTPIFLVSAIRSHLKGMSPTNAQAFLQSLPNVLDARVVQSPFGLPWLPLFSSRITVNIQQEVTGTASP